MIKEAIDRILDLRDETTMEIDDRVYIKAGYTPVKDPVAAVLHLHTLTGIRDYISNGIDKDHDPTIIHIVEYNQVDLITGLIGEWKQRETRLTATSHEHANVNGRWRSVEDFIIMLHAEFVENEGANYLKRITAGIVDSASNQIKDNGITQTATVKSGISLVEETEIKNPITLKPYRTFPEIEQPEISFVFRIRKGTHGPECALFESDGGKWKSDTIQTIKAWLKNELDGEVSIIA